MSKYILPLFLSLLLIAENMFVTIFSPISLGGQSIVVPHFLFIGLLFITLYYDAKLGVIYGAIFGFIFDVVNTEIIGIYLACFPFFTFLISQAMKVLYANLFVRSLLAIIWIAGLEYLVYGLNYLFGYTTMDNAFFMVHRLIPTLLLNAFVLLFAAYPLFSFLKGLKEKNEEN
jgi:rod shape-determining protein MreD